MTALHIDIEASEVGMSKSRLDRLDRHFRRYVDDGRLTGWLIAVARAGSVAHLANYGMRDREVAAPVETDTVWRLASMTKPITSVAAMMLYEEGAFELKDPISKWIPYFDEMRVYRSGSSNKPDVRPAIEPIRVWHLLTHTSGLTYGFHYAHPVDAMYRSAGFEWGNPPGVDLAGCCELWAAQPLLFEPGSEWNYGVSTDVLGRLVEADLGPEPSILLPGEDLRVRSGWSTPPLTQGPQSTGWRHRTFPTRPGPTPRRSVFRARHRCPLPRCSREGVACVGHGLGLSPVLRDVATRWRTRWHPAVVI